MKKPPGRQHCPILLGQDKKEPCQERSNFRWRGAAQAAPLQFLTGCSYGYRREYSGRSSRWLPRGWQVMAVNTFHFEDKKEISAITLSYGPPSLDREGVMPPAVTRPCKPQCCRHSGPGSWTGTIRPAWYGYKWIGPLYQTFARYRGPVCLSACPGTARISHPCAGSP